MARLSVIVPIYNARQYLTECVESILHQSVQDIEVLLVDDGSTDGSGALCDSFAAKDSRVCVIHKENGGPQSCVLAGAAQASAPYTTFVDSDDYVDIDIYACLLDAAEKNGAALVECGYVRVGNGPDRIFASAEECILDAAKLKTEVLTPFLEQGGVLRCFTAWSRWNKVFETHLLQQAVSLCPAELWLGEDCTLLLAFLLRCPRAVILKGEPHYFYRYVPGSITASLRRLVPERPFLTNMAQLAESAGYGTAGLSRYGTHLYCMDLNAVLFAKISFGEKQRLFAAARGRLEPGVFEMFCAEQPRFTRMALHVMAGPSRLCRALLMMGLCLYTTVKGPVD